MPGPSPKRSLNPLIILDDSEDDTPGTSAVNPALDIPINAETVTSTPTTAEEAVDVKEEEVHPRWP